jgi:glycosyltransferase involved in cell wall biosynthesis
MSGPKLIIQIPCYNEAATLPAVIRDLPRSLAGVGAVEYLVVDDGSADRTAEVARSLGVHHVVSLGTNRGLAAAFRAGIDACLERGADIVVNTDGDNQYCGEDVARLVAPIVEGRAGMVVGERPIQSTAHFSATKKLLQRFGSAVVRGLSGTKVKDAPSGFRAFSREALLRMNLTSDYTYTIESIIQCGRRGIRVESVPVRTNGPTRESRLMRSTGSYVGHSLGTMLRVWLSYSPLRIFLGAAAVFIAGGLGLSIRFLVLLAAGRGGGHVQSLILAAVLFFLGFQLVVIGLLADLVSVNRRLIEQLRYDQRLTRFAARRDG